MTNQALKRPSRIITPKAPTKVRPNMPAVNRALKAYYAKRDAETKAAGKEPRAGARRAEMIKHLKQLVTLIGKQLQTGFRLDLSDDVLSRGLKLSIKQVQKLRLLLKDVGVIFFPKWSRCTQPGDYPWWMMKFEYMVFEAVEHVKRAVKNRKYVAQYYDLYREACREAYSDLEKMDIYVTPATYMMMVYEILDVNLKREGLTKEDLLA